MRCSVVVGRVKKISRGPRYHYNFSDFLFTEYELSSVCAERNRTPLKRFGTKHRQFELLYSYMPVYCSKTHQYYNNIIIIFGFVISEVWNRKNNNLLATIVAWLSCFSFKSLTPYSIIIYFVLCSYYLLPTSSQCHFCNYHHAPVAGEHEEWIIVD